MQGVSDTEFKAAMLQLAKRGDAETVFFMENGIKDVPRHLLALYAARILHKARTAAHTEDEATFNALWNNPSILLQRAGCVYRLERDTAAHGPPIHKRPYDTFYTRLPDSIHGTLTLWNMRIDVGRMRELQNADSDSEAEEDDAASAACFAKRTMVKAVTYDTKAECIRWLHALRNDDGYRPFSAG